MMFLVAAIIQLFPPPVKTEYKVSYSPPRYYICRADCPKPSKIHVVRIIKVPISVKVKEKKAEVLSVYFDFDRYYLKPDEKKKIERFVKHGEKYRILGYADCIGTKKYNLWLSEKRAQTVAEFIEKLGGVVEKVEGKGELPPPPGPTKRKVEVKK
ncbi:OmpA family protein [Desulfurobacterium sp. TC5-1]|uniref:OmpA family protein n=1 Tax=Desulfurobacterium sp. TC5-1 TaxID=1158318 RepID=UPI000424CD8E|nr:OmpA family protein [Desulfurobacterium sp. TC5-1]